MLLIDILNSLVIRECVSQSLDQQLLHCLISLRHEISVGRLRLNGRRRLVERVPNQLEAISLLIYLLGIFRDTTPFVTEYEDSNPFPNVVSSCRPIASKCQDKTVNCKLWSGGPSCVATIFIYFLTALPPNHRQRSNSIKQIPQLNRASAGSEITQIVWMDKISRVMEEGGRSASQTDDHSIESIPFSSILVNLINCQELNGMLSTIEVSAFPIQKRDTIGMRKWSKMVTLNFEKLCN